MLGYFVLFSFLSVLTSNAGKIRYADRHGSTTILISPLHVGSSVKTAVIKATRSELTAPKKKHVAYLVASTKGAKPNVHAILKGLRSRGLIKDWMVALKSLCVTHRLLMEADPSFAQACARTTVVLQADFADVKDPAGIRQSEWIRIYSRYLEHKVKIIRTFNVQFEDMPDQVLDYDFDKLFPALKHMLVQLAYILEFEKRLPMLDNAITKTSFGMVLRDAINLYGALLKGFLRVTEEYREMSRSEVEDAADLYEKFIDYSERLVEDFFPKCKSFLRKMPNFDPAPEAMLKELDNFARDQAPENPPAGRKMRIMAAREGNPMYEKKKSSRSKDSRVKEVNANDRSSSSRSSSRSGRDRDGDRDQERSRDRGDRNKREDRSRRERSRERKPSSRQRQGSDVSFEDIPASWLADLKPQNSSNTGDRRSANKDKDEYYSDEYSRSEDEAPRDPFDSFQGSARTSEANSFAGGGAGAGIASRPPLSGGFSSPSQAPQQQQQFQQQQFQQQQFQPQQQQQAPPQQFSSGSALTFDPFAPSVSAPSASFGSSNNNASFGYQSQPSASSMDQFNSGQSFNTNNNNRLSGNNFGSNNLDSSSFNASSPSGYSMQPSSAPSGAVAYDPFATLSPAQPQMPQHQQQYQQSQMPPQQQSYMQSPMMSGVSASYDPFSPSRLSMGNSSMSSPAVSSKGPNVLDSYQFDPFKVVNVPNTGSANNSTMDL